ncbi:MAG: hypothetical protein IJW35_07430 [Lentisphaeria bacterium]|nr:hypothetical protein [Lentisphaeria bacterium]
MKTWGWLFIAVLLFSGCTAVSPAPRSLEQWQAVAKARYLAGESAAKLERCTQLAADDRRRHELPDLLKFIRQKPPEQATEIALDFLREAVAIASIRLVMANDTPLAVATRLCTGELDYLTASLLTEKSRLDAEIWKTPELAAHEAEVLRELTALLGSVPPPESYQLITPQAITPSPLPEIIRKTYGASPAALLKFADVVLALPAEFARQLIASPDAQLDGVWLETRYHAAMCAVSFTEHFLSEAWQAYQRHASSQNLARYRKWYYRRRQALADVPLVRGNESDIRSLEAMLQLHNHL